MLFVNFVFATGQDTIYYDENWEPTKQGEAEFFRLFEVQDSVIQIWDYYESGELQMTGFYHLPENDTSILDYFTSNEDDDRQTGIHIIYDKKGNKRRLIDYDPVESDTVKFPVIKQFVILPDSIKGKWSYSMYYYGNGEIEAEGFYLDKVVKHGEWLRYYKNGSLESRTDYYLGYLHGQRIAYYSTTEIMESGHYKWDYRDGETIGYDFDGLPKTRKIYKMGVLIKKEKISAPPRVEMFGD